MAITLSVGQSVVIGSEFGIIRYIGQVDGKQGTFAGVELVGQSVGRGKNEGAVDGKQYFSVSHPKSGIFLPYEKLLAQTQLGTSSPTIASPFTPSLNRRTSLLDRRTSNNFGTPLKTKNVPPVDSIRSKGPTTPSRQSGRFVNDNETPNSHLGKLTPIAGSVGRPTAVDTPVRKQNTRQPISTMTGTSAELQEKNMLIEELETANQQLLQERDTLKIQLAEKEQEIASQTTILKDLESCTVDFERIISERDRNEDIMKNETAQKMNHLQEEIEWLKHELNSKKDQITAMKSEMDKKRAEFRDMTETLEIQLKDTSQLYREENESLQAENEKLSQENTELREKLNQLSQNPTGPSDAEREEMQNLIQQVSQLQLKLQEAESETTKAHDQLKKTEQEKKHFESELVNSKRQQEMITYQLEEAREQIQSLEKQPQQTTSEADISKYLQDIDSMKAKNLALNREVRSLQLIISQRDTREKDLQAQMEELKKQLEKEKQNTQQVLQQVKNQPIKQVNRITSIIPTNDDDIPIYVAPPTDPAAGRSEWCGLCEREGHGTADCPYGDEEY